MRELPLPLILPFAFVFALFPLVGNGAPLIVPSPPCLVKGEIPITSEARPLARAAEIPDNVTCWDPNSQYVGKVVGDAKRYLLSIAKGLDGTQAPPDEAHIAKLNDVLAICAAKFFQDYKAAYGPVRITSAYRDGPSGENKAAGGSPTSNHMRGYAIDVHPSGKGASYQTLWAFASKYPKYGVCFPHQDGKTTTRYPDAPHMILAGIGGNEGKACDAQGVTRPCDGLSIKVTPFQVPEKYDPPSEIFVDPRFPLEAPTIYQLQHPYNQSLSPYNQYNQSLMPNRSSSGMNMPNIPLSGIGNLLSGLFGSDKKGEKPEPQTCQPRFNCIGNTLYYHTSTCTQQVFQSCPYGCASSGTQCASPPPPTQNPGTSAPPPPPVSDSIKFPPSSPILDSSNVATLQPTTPRVITPTTTTVIQPVYTSPQTFTSSDLANTGPQVQTFGAPPTSGPLFYLLTALRNTLANILSLLQPFGGFTPR